MSQTEHQEEVSFWSFKFILQTFIPIVMMMICAASSYTVLRNVKDAIIEKHLGIGVIPVLKLTAVLFTVFLFTYCNDLITEFFIKKSKAYYALICMTSFFAIFYCIMWLIMPYSTHMQDPYLASKIINFFGFDRPDYNSIFPKYIAIVLNLLYTIFAQIGCTVCNVIGSIFGCWIATLFYSITEVYGMCMISIVVWGTANQIIPQNLRMYYPFIGTFSNIVTFFALEGNRKLSSLNIEEFNNAAASISLWRGLIPTLMILILYIYISNFNNLTVKASKKQKSQGFLESCVEVSRESYARNIAIIVASYNFLIVTAEIIYKAYISSYYSYSDISVTVGQVNVFFAVLIVVAECIPRILSEIFKKRKGLGNIIPFAFIAALCGSVYTIYTYFGHSTLVLGLISAFNAFINLKPIYLIITGILSACCVVYVVRSNSNKSEADDSSWLIKALIAAFAMGFTGILYFMVYIWKDEQITGNVALWLGLTTPGFIVIIGAIQNIASKAFKYTYFDATKETAFAAAPTEIKVRFKAIIDIAVNRYSKSFAAGIAILAGCISPMFMKCCSSITGNKDLIVKYKEINDSMSEQERKDIKKENDRIELNAKAPFLLIIFILVFVAWCYAVIALYPQYQAYIHPDKKIKPKTVTILDLIKLIIFVAIAIAPIYGLLRIFLGDQITIKKQLPIDSKESAKENSSVA